MSLLLKDINKKFGRNVVIENFNFSFSDIGLYIVNGESGVGKTTLLRIIAGLDEDYIGTVFGGGFENVSFAFQEYRLFSKLSSLENITEILYENASDSQIQQAVNMLKRLGFSESEMKLLPDELSGGMKQRVALARAFLKKSSVLLLDEPTKELDAQLCREIRAIIKEEAEKRLVIMVTHSEEDMSLLDHTRITLS